MREFDEIWLEPVLALKPEEIRARRERENVSQPVFAHYLNVSKKTLFLTGNGANENRAALP